MAGKYPKFPAAIKDVPVCKVSQRQTLVRTAQETFLHYKLQAFVQGLLFCYALSFSTSYSYRIAVTVVLK